MALEAANVAELSALQDRIRMVGAYYREGKSGPTDLFYLERRPLDHGFWLVRHEEEATDIEPLCVITTRHSRRGAGDTEFDPTYEEYYSQIPQELLKDVVAIECSGRDVRIVGDVFETQTTLYKKKT